jgi:Flp pilus assembly pilin Flp
MRRLLQRLWSDDTGALLATEWVLIAGIAVFGLIPGLVAIRGGIDSALATEANVLIIINSNFSFEGWALVVGTNTCALVSGVSISNISQTFQSAPGPVLTTGIFVFPCP